MKKKNKVQKLGKAADQRNALIRSQVKDLLERGHIKTTKARAKVVSQRIDSILSFVVEGNSKSVKEFLMDKELFNKVMKFNVEGRKSGFVSLRAIENRSGDNAERVLVELLVK